MHQYVLVPSSSDFLAVHASKYAVSVDAVVLEWAFDWLSVGQDQLTFSWFAVFNKLAWIFDDLPVYFYQYSWTSSKSL